MQRCKRRRFKPIFVSAHNNGRGPASSLSIANGWHVFLHALPPTVCWRPTVAGNASLERSIWWACATFKVGQMWGSWKTNQPMMCPS